jgi:hypothetical protein
MEFTWKTSAWATIAISAWVVGLCPAAHAEQETKTHAMPAAQENALVQKYCAVCHDDAHRNGGLSLQHFDASHVEPSLAAMMVSKLKSGAMGAAGIARPDAATQDAFLDVLTAQSAGANEWVLTRTQDPVTQTALLTASIVLDVPSTPELYRLKLTCRPDTREAEMQLSWSPNPGEPGRAMSVEVDGSHVVTHPIEGREKMGNGSKTNDGKDVTTGPAAAMLYTTHPSSGAPNLTMPLPKRTLTVSKLFPNETVVFPFDRLTDGIRREVSACFR